MTSLLILAVAFLAGANGANDNFKGVAGLYGSGVAGYRSALAWGCITTLAGSLLSAALATKLLSAFTGAGLLAPALALTPRFAAAVALGGAFSVALAAWRGLPISTTHALIGAMCGVGLFADGGLRWATLSGSFLLPLLVSPLLAWVPARLLRAPLLRLAAWAGSRSVCAGAEPARVATQGQAMLLAPATLRLDRSAACEADGAPALVRLDARRMIDWLHWGAAGAVGFARGLNDTPKIAALLMALAMPPQLAVSLVGVGMLLGALLGARRVAHTLARRISRLQVGDALAASLTTAALVGSASFDGLPVSTTHVAVGALAGAGRSPDRGVLGGIVAAWVVTLPLGAAFGAAAYRLLS